jgi:integrase/recombinase XerD
MSSFPCLVRFVSGSGQVRYRLGDRLVDRYLEFVAGRSRPNTLRAVAFDLKTFFTVVGKDPVEVTAVDVFEFLAHQRGDRSVVLLADRESGLSARTVARRLSSVSGLYAYLVARGDTPVRASPVPRGLSTRRQMRALNRRLSDVVFRQMAADARAARTGPGGHPGGGY